MKKIDQTIALVDYYDAVNILDKQLKKREILEGQHKIKIRDLMLLRVDIENHDTRSFKKEIYDILNG